MTRRKRLPPLGDLEEAVLEHLWTVGESDVQKAHRAVGKRRGSSINTVGSALERLFRKNLVSREKVSHAYRYRACMDRAAFRAMRLLDAAGGARALASEGVLAAFVDLVADADEEALEHLEELISKRRESR